MPVDQKQVHDLLYQAYETEFGASRSRKLHWLAHATTIYAAETGSTISARAATTLSWSKSHSEPSVSTLSRIRPGARSSAIPAKH